MQYYSDSDLRPLIKIALLPHFKEEEIEKMLDEGNEKIGEYLKSIASVGFSAQEVVHACEEMNFQEIYKKAKNQLAVESIYQKWLEEYNKQASNDKKSI